MVSTAAAPPRRRVTDGPIATTTGDSLFGAKRQHVQVTELFFSSMKPGCRLNHLLFCGNTYLFGLHQEVHLRLGVDVVGEVPTDHFFYFGYLVLRVPLHQVVLSL